MSQLATIFEKIREDFFANHVKDENKEKYSLVFSPFSTGFNYDDFLFLDTNMASEDAQKYLDELYEFSQIANTIPRQDNFWAVSDHQDYLFNPFKNILNSLHLIDPDSFKIEMFYDHPIFPMALEAIDPELSGPYRSFFDLRIKFLSEIGKLKESLTDVNRKAVDLEIKMKENNLVEIEKNWLSEGKKQETETKILAIIKDEFKRFMSRFIDVKGQLETLIRNHAGSGSDFYLTSCMPNNLFKSEGLDWVKIELKKSDIKSLIQKIDKEKYKDILGTSELSKLEVETIKFELLFVSITRAWFDESILNSPFWDINILNKNEIDIPRITSKLIFIRKVDIKLPESSNQNKLLLKNNIIQNLGPFIINTNQLKKGQNLRLQSVNQSLKLDRKTILNVGSKLRKKQQRNKNLGTVITSKQHQFIQLAPQLKKKQVVRRAAVRPGHRAILAKPMMITAMLAWIKCEFNFIEKNTNKAIPVLPQDLQVFYQNKLQSIKFTVQASNKLIGNLTLNGNYRLVINSEGYQTTEIQFKAIPIRNGVKLVRKTIQLEKQAEEAFQLIGVIAKKIAPFPNPVKGADYL